MGSANFPPGCSFLSGRCFAVFKHTQMICDGYVKVAPRKPHTGRVKLKISSGTGEAKCSQGEVKKSTGSGLTGSVIEGCDGEGM